MPKFKVPFTVTYEASLEVEASSIEEARAIVAETNVDSLLAVAPGPEVEVFRDFDLIQFGIVPNLQMSREEAIKAACIVLEDNGYPVEGKPEVIDKSPDAIVVLLKVGGDLWEDLQAAGTLQFDGQDVTVSAEMP